MQDKIWQSIVARCAGKVAAWVTIAALAAIAIALSSALLAEAYVFAYSIVGFGISLLLVAAGWMKRARKKQLERLTTRLDVSLESLKDLQWEVHEREARYRDLLDRQGDVIARHNADGKVLFVNDAFCQTFGVAREAVLGQNFELPILCAEAADAQSVEETGRASRVIELLTSSGPRWFVWDQFEVPHEGDGPPEIQCTGRDITKQRAAEMDLAKARDHAMTANEAKSRFLAYMSHEIRTPLNGLLGMAELLSETKLSPEQKTYTHAISSSATNLLSLIDDVLDFSKIEAGKIELRPRPFDLSDTLQSVAELLAPRANGKGLEMGWFAAPSLPRTLIGDEMRIRQILMNLLGNAIKFTENGGVALIAEPALAARDDGQTVVRFAVHDTGPGVPPEALERIFAEFEQGELEPAHASANGEHDGGRPHRRTTHRGTGLGLTISKRLTEEMGGEIKARRASQTAAMPWSGATFTVDLPLKPYPQTPSLGAAWPRPNARENVLVVLSGPTEAYLAGALIKAAGAGVTSAKLDDALHLAEIAANEGRPFTALLTDSHGAKAGANRIIPLLAQLSGGTEVPAIVILDQGERHAAATLSAEGYSGSLVRPVRPLLALSALFCDGGQQQKSPSPALCQEPYLEPFQAKPQVAPCLAAGLSVLLAEDNAINSLLARTMLEKAGAFVVHARDGAEAVNEAKEALAAGKGFDLVLMDIHMPRTDGFEAARAIRGLYGQGASPGFGRPAIVALTANAFAKDRAACLAAGLDDYLAKPFDQKDLTDLVARWLGPNPTVDAEAG